MKRPLMQHGVGQLEQLFATSREDTQVLKQLESELRYRQVPRAVSLLAEVQAALYTSPATSKPQSTEPAFGTAPARNTDSGWVLKAPPVQPPLWGTSAGEEGEFEPKPSQAPALIPPKLDRPAETKILPEAERSPDLPLVTLADAYKLFKATASSTWESIEQKRRQDVQLSSPSRLASMTDHQRREAREQAQRLNAAYEVLSRARAIH